MKAFKDDLKLGIAGASILLTAAILAACSASTTSTPSIGGGGDGPDSGPEVPAPASGTYFSLDAIYPSPVFSRTHISTDWTKSCKVDLGASTWAEKDVICYTEADELDIFLNDLQLKIEVPPAACAYVLVTPYWMYLREAGRGSSSFSYTMVNGRITSVTDPSSLTTTDGSQLICKYNYPNRNCCFGSYTANVTVDGTPATENGTWGSNTNAANCIGGAGADSSWEKTDSGFPASVFYTTLGGSTIDLQFGKPILSDNSPFKFVNYTVDPSASHVAFENPDPSPDPTDFNLPNPQRYYTFGCLDGAGEYLGRIQLMVREWNQAKELAKESEGDPDTTGTEEGGFPINDWADWEDIGNTFPGF